MDSTSHPTRDRAFLALPAELIEHIASFLPKEDLLNFRLACRQCHRKSTAAFADAFFSTVYIDLCPPPLQRLQRIAQHDLLRRHVRTVIFAPYPETRCTNRPPEHPPNHLPGTGYHWARDPSTHRLDPSDPPITTLRTSLALLPNLRTLTVHENLGRPVEPSTPDSSGLLLLDTIHIALLCAAHLPLKTFRVTQGVVDAIPMPTHPLLPCAGVLAALTPTSPWGTHLVELTLRAYPVPYGAADAEQDALLAGLVQRAGALRRLVVLDATEGFCGLLREGGGALPPLEVLELRGLGTVRAEVLGGCVLRFSGTLRYLYVCYATAGTGTEWCRMLGGWAAGLERLRSFGVRDLRVDGMAGQGMVVFDDIARWEGGDVPEGTLTFAARHVNSRTEAVSGVRFTCAKGREGDAQRVLGKLAEVGRIVGKHRINGQQVYDTGCTVVEKRFVIGGKLEANFSLKFNSPGLEAME